MQESFDKFSNGASLNQLQQAKATIRELRWELKNCDYDEKEHFLIEIADNGEIVRGLKKDLGLP